MDEHFGIILMIDALGVSKYNLEKCKTFLEKRRHLERELKVRKNVLGSLPGASHYKNSSTSIFGDTIIHCWPIEKDQDDRYFVLTDVVSDSCEIMHWGLTNGILFRGCISVGEYVTEKNTVLGPALFDANDWYESADWFGIIVSPKGQLWVELVLEEYKRKSKHPQTAGLGLQEFLVPYDVPLSYCSGSQTTKRFLTIGWPETYDKTGEYKNTNETHRENLLKDLFKMDQSKEGESKFKNSIDFFDWHKKEFYQNRKFVLPQVKQQK
jgi:hypothetical protein